AQHFGGDIVDQQQLDPVEQLGGRGLFLQSRHLANVIKDGQGLAHEFVLQTGKMHIDDLLHRRAVGKANVMKKAAAQKGVRQLFLIVRGDDDDRAVSSLNRAPRLVDIEFHAVELEQQVVGELDIGLVDLVDQKDRGLLRLEGFPQLARHDVIGNVVHPLIAE